MYSRRSAHLCPRRALKGASCRSPRAASDPCARSRPPPLRVKGSAGGALRLALGLRGSSRAAGLGYPPWRRALRVALSVSSPSRASDSVEGSGTAATMSVPRTSWTVAVGCSASHQEYWLGFVHRDAIVMGPPKGVLRITQGLVTLVSPYVAGLEITVLRASYVSKDMRFEVGSCPRSVPSAVAK